MEPGNVVDIVAVLSIFVLSPLSIALGRLIWKRASQPPAPPALSDDATHRLVQMQQSLDAMAIEIERISENQRFVTRLMSERPAGELAAPAASAVPATRKTSGRRAT